MTELRDLLESKEYHRIPLKRLKTGHYKLDVLVNGRKGEFILDTGASTSCIGLENTGYFHLNSLESEIKAAGAGAIDMETRISTGNRLKIGPLQKRNLDFVLFDLTHVNTALDQVEEDKVQGILGADLLKKYRAVIDYGRNVLFLK